MTNTQSISVRNPDTGEVVDGTVDMFYQCGHVSLSLPGGGSILIVDPCIGQRIYTHESEIYCGACVIVQDSYLYLRRTALAAEVCTIHEDDLKRTRTHARVNLFLGLIATEARTISSLQQFGKVFVGDLIDALEEQAEKSTPDCKTRLESANNFPCSLCSVIMLFQELSAHVATVAGSDPRRKMKVLHSLYLYLLSVVFNGRVHTRAYTEGLCLIANTDERPFDWHTASRPLHSIGYSRQA